MFKQNIAYTDFNGQERQEDFYFHLSLPEVTRLEAKFKMSLAEYTQDLVSRQDPDELITFLEKIVLSSYGRKTADGKSFRKNAELREEFEYSQAYAEFFEALLTDPALAAKFGEGVADNGKQRKNTVTPSVIE
ncbi:hypothetical protein [Pedobacter sp.]|uniref:hypothetical protein n=1 Tax=Pedobacter sp. TaxID=1411316 RepID=UPI003D7F4AB8